MTNNPITSLLKIQYPIIQGGMVWTSGWKLASAVSNSGGLGVLGAGSMNTTILEEHLTRMDAATSNAYGVNLPLLYSHVEDQIALILKHQVSVIITSAGSPAKYTQRFKEAGLTVLHVVSSSKFAQKAEAAGVDAVIAEGFEAGGHNGREETTTLCLIPQVVDAVQIPVVAAGGIATGKAMAAVFALGAQGVQVGTRFALTPEASSSNAYKQKGVEAQEGATQLTLKELAPVRLLKGPFSEQVDEAYQKGAGVEELRALLGKGRSRKGVFEGNWEEGEFEIGQVCAQIKELVPAAEVVHTMMAEFRATLQMLRGLL